MKGVSLPINTIVIVAIAVLVLMVIGGFFAVNVGQGQNSIELNNAISTACATFVNAYNCDIDRVPLSKAQYRKPGDAEASTLDIAELCQEAKFADTQTCIVAKCGCSLPSASDTG
ncbi:MAG: hypothetical protein HY364_00440 [Candidatus Aenigmarchaeota archaeon]|nr:hypothetical protein [Candidatus Aenigmarchaeota archaeon]